jgi:hypothetical protein
MSKNLVLAVALSAIVAILGSVAGSHVLAQTPASQWQLIVSNGGDGGNAWKFNPSTGQSYFCYRQNCSASKIQP